MEKKLPKKIEDELDFLEKASNDELCEYLKNLKKENTYNLEYHPKIKKVFTKIFNNKNKNVKLALIKYYPDSQLAERFLLESSDKELREECLKKKAFFGPLFYKIGGYKEEFVQFLNKASNEELYSYFTNPAVDLNSLRDFFERDEDETSLFTSISDKLYRNIVLILEDNPNVHKEPDLADYEDGWGLYTDGKTFKKFHQELKLIKKMRSLE